MRRCRLGFAITGSLVAFLLQGCGTFHEYNPQGGRPHLLRDKDCTTDDCNVRIDVHIRQVDGKDYCLAQLAEKLLFHNTDGHPGSKVITWTIVPDPGDLPVQFLDRGGILVVGGDKPNQLNPDSRRASLLTYNATNKRDDKGIATYVPVILYGSIKDTKDDVAQVCATGDPRIAND